MVAGTFGVVTVVGGRGDDDHELDDYRGLSRRYPVLAGLMSVLLFAQAGVPFTSGFFAKFRVIAAAAGEESYVLAAVAMLAAVVAAVLYLRVVVRMFLIDAVIDVTDATDATDATVGGRGAGTAGGLVTPSWSAVAAVAVAAVVTILLGLLPDLGGGVLSGAAEAMSAFR
jgi:NADH-quinone oxidoreductase subunit N